jgi:hypothetical protein
MKWRIDNVFSLNSEHLYPETNYMVQKRVWGVWENVQMFVQKEAATEFIYVEKELAKNKKGWPI